VAGLAGAAGRPAGPATGRDLGSPPTAGPTNRNAALTSRRCAPCPESMAGARPDISRQLLAHPQQRKGPVRRPGPSGRWRYLPLTRTPGKALTCNVATLGCSSILSGPRRPSVKRPRWLRGCLDDRSITDPITTSYAGATGACVASGYGGVLRVFSTSGTPAGDCRTSLTRANSHFLMDPVSPASVVAYRRCQQLCR
jgi:hypothetical protein